MAQCFCGQDTLVSDAYGIKSTKQLINALADNIRNNGAMHTLISDGDSYEISKKVIDLFDHSLLLIASLNPIISTKTRLRINGALPEMGQQDHEFMWLPSFSLASLPPIYLGPPQSHVLSCPG